MDAIVTAGANHRPGSRRGALIRRRSDRVREPVRERLQERLQERLVVSALAVVAAVAGLLGPAGVVAAAPVPPASPSAPSGAGSTALPRATVSPAEPWWVPVGLRGERVTAVTAVGDVITVTASGRTLTSPDAGRTFAGAAPPGAPSAAAPAEVTAGPDRWAVRAGAVLHAGGTGPLLPDPGGPDLGAGARLLAAPAALPGQVVVVSDAGVVWRRAADGTWGRSLVLLPAGLLSGRPDITAVTAFAAAPLSTGIYLATAGYSVLLTSDGGESWVRAGPGLPDDVLALTSDVAARSVFAGTADGLWVHHLRTLPGIPVYTGPDLGQRRAGTIVITALGILAGALLLVALVPRRARRLAGRAGGGA